jgi:hypothetical protein
MDSNMDSNNVIMAQSSYRSDRLRWRHAAVVVAIASHLVVTDAASAQGTGADVIRAATVGQGPAPESRNDAQSPSPSIDNHSAGLADTINLRCIAGIEGVLGSTVAIAFDQHSGDLNHRMEATGGSLNHAGDTRDVRDQERGTDRRDTTPGWFGTVLTKVSAFFLAGILTAGR